LSIKIGKLWVLVSRYKQNYINTNLNQIGSNILLTHNGSDKPGIMYKMANGIGMQTRFDAVESEVAKNRNPEERVEFSQNHFGMIQ